MRIVSSAKTILFIHGRDWKPGKDDLFELWKAALAHGIKRDYPEEKTAALKNVHQELVYYGDLSNDFLKKRKEPPNFQEDLEDRRTTLEALKNHGRADFTKEKYEDLPGRSSFAELLADTIGDVLGHLNLGRSLIYTVAPDMEHYWAEDREFGSPVRYKMMEPLKKALDQGEVMVISHSLGSIVAYDTFWKFSRMGEYRDHYWNKKIDLWITLGSPLGDEFVKRSLKGARENGLCRFPGNVKRWVNVYAEDDYISHDGKAANDFAEMEELMEEPLQDISIYNLAVRLQNGTRKSNPHSSLGYLIHPEVAKTVADWL